MATYYLTVRGLHHGTGALALANHQAVFAMTAKATLEHIGAGGHVVGFDVLINGDTVVVSTPKAIIAKRNITGLGKFFTAAKNFKLGWARTEDFNIVYLYDQGDDNFGYAINLEAPDYSEWGYAPFSKEA